VHDADRIEVLVTGEAVVREGRDQPGGTMSHADVQVKPPWPAWQTDARLSPCS
jgi:hypothetical protein